MSKREITPVAAELIAAKKRIEDPENWCQGTIGWQDKVCAAGALGRDRQDLFNCEAYRLLDESGWTLFNHCVPNVNDSLGHSAVMQMYDHAIQRALSKGK